MAKITRVRTGCWTCKARKCDEAKPFCNNCIKTGRDCEGHGIRLSFDVDDSRNKNRNESSGGQYGFRGRPRLTESLAARNGVSSIVENNNNEKPKVNSSQNASDKKGIKSELLSENISMLTATKIDKFLELAAASNVTQSQSSSHIDKDKRESDQIQMNLTNNQLLAKNSDLSPVTSGTSQPFNPLLLNDLEPANFTDISDPFQFETALYDGLDYLLNSTSSPQLGGKLDLSDFRDIYNNITNNNSSHNKSMKVEVRKEIPESEVNLNATLNHPTSFDSKGMDIASYRNSMISSQMAKGGGSDDVPALEEEIVNFIDNTNLYSNTTSVSYSEENMMLKHFFNKLLPLLDAHPSSPWPELALKYCDFEIARSCFISLSCMHLYESRGGNEFYRRGLMHINNTMDYLVKYVKGNPHSLNQQEQTESQSGVSDQNNNDSAMNVARIVGDLKEDTIKKKQSSFFVIMLLIYVHLLFGILESGRSALARIFFKLFACIAEDQTFVKVLKNIDQSQSLICVLSWFDTVTALVSPDCRLPYCNPDWYGSKKDPISTSRMMGCPGEIFRCMASVCKLRRDIKYNNKKRDLILLDYEEIKAQLMAYRDYVELEGDDYFLRLSGAQCWMLGVYTVLIKCVKPNNHEELLATAVSEFIHVYGSMDPSSPVVTQMVWPVFGIGCETKTDYERAKMRIYMETLYKNAKMGTLMTLKTIVEEIWTHGKSQEEILDEWLKAGIDYLPL